VTSFLPISTTFDPRRQENTQLSYGDKNLCRNYVGRSFENQNI